MVFVIYALLIRFYTKHIVNTMRRMKNPLEDVTQKEYLHMSNAGQICYRFVSLLLLE